MSSRALSYVESIVEYCQDAIDIKNSLGNSYEVFLQEKCSQYSISFCVEQVGELAKKLRDNEGYEEKYPDIPWKKIAGMRNHIAHGYHAIDLELVYCVAAKDLPELLENCKQILLKEMSLVEKIEEANKLQAQQNSAAVKKVIDFMEK